MSREIEIGDNLSFLLLLAVIVAGLVAIAYLDDHRPEKPVAEHHAEATSPKPAGE